METVFVVFFKLEEKLLALYPIKKHKDKVSHIKKDKQGKEKKINRRCS